MKLNNNSLLLYAVTDRTWLKGRNLSSQVEEALKAGISFIQLREKDKTFDEFVRVAKKIKSVTDKYNVPFVINDNIEVALEVGADGVHVGQKDMVAKNARMLIGEEKILGVSVNTVEQAILAEKNGADYLGVGSVFTTTTKLDAKSVSYNELKNICNSVSIPVVAIGGISKDNILELKGSGIKGVAVISAIFAQPNIQSATKELLNLSKEMLEA